MRMVEQFRVRDSKGVEHLIVVLQGSYGQPSSNPEQRWEYVDTVPRYKLNGAEEVQRIDDDTFLTDTGNVLRRVR